MRTTRLEFNAYPTLARAEQLLKEAGIEVKHLPGWVLEISEFDEKGAAEKLAEYRIYSEFTTPHGLTPDYFVDK
jgi:hypothetical protein